MIIGLVNWIPFQLHGLWIYFQVQVSSFSFPSYQFCWIISYPYLVWTHPAVAYHMPCLLSKMCRWFALDNHCLATVSSSSWCTSSCWGSGLRVVLGNHHAVLRWGRHVTEYNLHVCTRAVMVVMELVKIFRTVIISIVIGGIHYKDIFCRVFFPGLPWPSLPPSLASLVLA